MQNKIQGVHRVRTVESDIHGEMSDKLTGAINYSVSYSSSSGGRDRNEVGRRPAEALVHRQSIRLDEEARRQRMDDCRARENRRDERSEHSEANPRRDDDHASGHWEELEYKRAQTKSDESSMKLTMHSSSVALHVTFVGLKIFENPSFAPDDCGVSEDVAENGEKELSGAIWVLLKAATNFDSFCCWQGWGVPVTVAEFPSLRSGSGHRS